MMEGLGAGLYAMTLVSAIGGLLLLLFGDKKRLCASLRTVISLILLVMLISPLLSAFDEARAWFSALSFVGDGVADAQNAALSSLYEEKSIAYATAASEEALRLLLSAQTGVAVDDMLVTLQTDASDAENVRVTAVEIELLKKKDHIARDKTKSYTEQTLGCPCTVITAGTLDAYFAKGGELIP